MKLVLVFFVLSAFAAFVSAAPADLDDVVNLSSASDLDVAESHHKKVKVYQPKVYVPKVKYVKMPVYKVVYKKGKKHHG